MGTIKPYETKTKGKLWEVWYTKPDGKRGHERGFKRQRDAAAYLTEVEGSKLRGSYVDPQSARVTVGELAADWLENHEATNTTSTHHSVASAWRIHVEPRWGNTAVGAVKQKDVQKWINGLTVQAAGKDPATGERNRKAASHTTQGRCRDLLIGILDDAIAENRIVTNEARGISVAKKPLPEEVYLTHKQVDALSKEAKHPDLVLFLAYTGLRYGEAVALRVRNVNLEARRVMIREAVAWVNGKPVLGSPKKHERRTVAYPDFLDDIIAAACEGKKGAERLWSSETGSYLHSGNSESGWFEGAVKRMMKADPSFERVTVHDLRHTAASLAISAGANVKVVQRMLGHKSAKVTLDTYAALFPDDLDNVTSALSQQRAEQM